MGPFSGQVPGKHLLDDLAFNGVGNNYLAVRFICFSKIRAVILAIRVCAS